MRELTPLSDSLQVGGSGDASRIVEYLTSSKISLRNQALTTLEQISINKLDLTPKIFSLLVRSLFDLIDIETKLYVKNPSSTAELRLRKASSFIRSLFENLESNKLKIKFKSYLDALNRIISTFYDPSSQPEFFYPCFMDFLWIIIAILDRSYFKEHLNYDDWRNIYNFLLKIISLALEQLSNHSQSFDSNHVNGNGNNHLKILSDTYLALRNLLQCDTTMSVTYIHLYKESNYLRLEAILRRTVSTMRKESLLTITVFKIINKLIITTATEDFHFVNKLIKLGVKLSISSCMTQWDSLRNEFLIFINLNATHDFLFLNAMPNVDNKSNTILHDDMDIEIEEQPSGNENEISITSDSEDLNISANSYVSSDSDEAFLYKVGALIQKLIERLKSIDYKLLISDIGLVRDGDHSINWFKLRTIYLKPYNHLSWMLRLGLAKLIDSYYANKLIMTELHERPIKRHKAHNLAHELQTSTSALQFFNRLISSDDDFSQSAGLQLLIFYIERDNFTITDSTHESGMVKSSTTELVSDANETVFADNTTFVIPSNARDERLFDRNVLLQGILATFSNSTISYWSSLASTCLLKGSIVLKDNFSDKKLNLKYVSQLLKLNLNFMDKSWSQIPCSLIHFLISGRSEDNLAKLIDSSITTQLDNILDLSEINGPNNICHESFQFWYSIFKAEKELNLPRKIEALSRIQDWFLSKWNSTFDTCLSRGNLDDLETLPEFISWLCGNPIHKSVPPKIHDVYKGDFEEVIALQDHYLKFQNFIVTKNLVVDTLELSSIPEIGENNRLQVLLTTIIDTRSRLSKYDAIIFFEWSIILQQIAGLIHDMPKFSEYVATFSEQFVEAILGLKDSSFDRQGTMNSVFKCFEKVGSLNSTSIDKLNSYFPFERYINHLASEIYPASVDSQLVNLKDAKFELKHGVSLCEILHCKSLSCPEILFILQSDKIMGNSLDVSVSSIITYLEQLNGTYLLVPFCKFTILLGSSHIDLKNVDEVLLRKLIRLFGEKILQNHEFERSEITLAAASMLLGKIVYTFDGGVNDNLKKDFNDMSSWMIDCGMKNMINSEYALLSYCSFLLDLLSNYNEIPLNVLELKSLFFKLFKSLPNNSKIGMMNQLINAISTMDKSSQSEFYTELIQWFSELDEKVEVSATYCMFLSNLSSVSSQILISSLFNLLECSRFHFFNRYIKIALANVCDYAGVTSPRTLLNSLKYEVFQCWWRYDSISNFPYFLFGFSHIDVLLTTYSRELVAMAIATEVKEKDAFLTSIKTLKNEDIQGLVAESLHYIIPISYCYGGIRNKVFDILPTLLPQGHAKEIEDKLIVIILEVFKFMDVGDEKSLLDIFKKDLMAHSLISAQNSIKVDNSLFLKVSLPSSLDLLKQLIGKYGRSTISFWQPKEMYFLIRKLTTLLKTIPANSTSAITLLIRRLKLILILGSSNIYNLDLVSLLVRELAPIMRNSNVAPDILLIFTTFKIQNFHRYDESLSIPLVAIIFASLLELPRGLVSPEIIEQLDQYRKCLGGEKYSSELFFIGVQALKGAKVNFRSSLVEKFLTMVERKYTDFDKSYALKFISLLFHCIDTYDEEGGVEEVVVILSNQTNILTTEFKIWAARYLGDFYLCGGLLQGTNEILQFDEFSDSISDSFQLSSKSLNGVVEQLIDYAEHVDNDDISSVESTLGVLLYKYQTSKKEVQKFIDFGSYLPRLKTILPIDFHTHVILNDDDTLDFSDYTLGHICQNLGAFINSNSYEMWTTKLLLSILNELAAVTSIMPLLATFIMKSPSFSSVVLPAIFSFYISVKGSAASDKVIPLLKSFLLLNIENEKASSLFTEFVLLIRIGAKLHGKEFKQVWESIDSRQLFKTLIKTKKFKSALMMFEDSQAFYDEFVISSQDAEDFALVYESIDELDLIYGLPERNTMDYTLSKGNISTKKLALESAKFDASLSLNSNLNDNHILYSMMNSGLIGISRLISLGVANEKESDEAFDWAWKLNKWELPAPAIATSESETIYKALKSINDYPYNFENIFKNSLLQSYNNKQQLLDKELGAKEFRSNSLTWYKSMAALKGMECLSTKSENSKFINSMEEFDERTFWFDKSDISQSENILKSRQVLLQIIADSPSDITKIDHEVLWIGGIHELSRYNKISRNTLESQKMVSSSVLINEIVKSKFNSSSSALKQNLINLSQYITACTLWSQGETSAPVLILEQLRKHGGIQLPLASLNVDSAVVNSHLVRWLIESRQDIASNIMENYVLPTAEILNGILGSNESAQVFSALAKFCETQYKSKTLQEQIQKLEKRVSDKLNEIDEMKTYYGRTAVPIDEKKAVQKYYSKLKNQMKSETTDLEELKRSKNEFSNKAVEFYLKSTLTNSESDDLDRFIALWLENSENEELNVSIIELVLKLPSYFLVNWSTQLISRLSNDSSSFQKILQQLIINFCCDHPHHTLYALISLRMHENHEKEGDPNVILASKCNAANEIWQSLTNKDGFYVDEILRPIEVYCEESVKLAGYKVTRGKPLMLNKVDCGKYWLEKLPHIPPVTKFLPIDHSKQYKNIPVLIKVEPKVHIATSGLSLPKIAEFTLSDGTYHKMLLKQGTDDLRQDLIMQQVFEKVNIIFVKDKETKHRNLNIKTYKVVPLGPQSGIIEFVPNSLALIDIIKPYHNKYDKLQIEKARDMMKECQSDDSTKRFKAYEKITKKIKPVLRLFFLDTFLTPELWFDSKIKYTRGIATTSIVGYILGLGDRHCNNILLDKITGEPIHIDLGVSFDQGRRLPIPETVPFRLTRDIVDGFGVTGVEGVFRKSCEHTFRVLRLNRDHILSILDVLRWDPLYSWSLSPIQMKKLQQQDLSEVSGGGGGLRKIEPQEDGTEAGRAVFGVQEKLIAGGLSVEATVRELIQDSTNPHKLALIYFGWCPFY